MAGAGVGERTVRIRRAVPSDVPAINGIYNEAVRTTTATFDLHPRALAQARRWFHQHGPHRPVLVAASAGSIVGWASLSDWSDRPAYAATAEVSVYVASEWRGRGIGRRLLGALLRRGDAVGLHSLLARVAEGNPASLRLHRSAGFRSVGVMREVGVKFGRRLDVHLLQRLSRADDRPRRPAPRGSRRRRD